jgi:FdhD protein
MSKSNPQQRSQQHSIRRYCGGSSVNVYDDITTEEPLALFVHAPSKAETNPEKNTENNQQIKLKDTLVSKQEDKLINLTMRTPGHDDWLAIGFLVGEGVLTQSDDLVSIDTDFEDDRNAVRLVLNSSVDWLDHQRHFSVNSSCGFCGKTSIKALELNSPYQGANDSYTLNQQRLLDLPNALRDAQMTFSSTGGIHGAALVNDDGQLVLTCEDVGRHNAVDKLVGHAFLHRLLPLSNMALLVSGRVSFEIMQKAIMAGVTTVIAIGAPTTLAIDVAIRFNLTLIGFLKSNSYNIYYAPHRIIESVEQHTQIKPPE